MKTYFTPAPNNEKKQRLAPVFTNYLLQWLITNSDSNKFMPVDRGLLKVIMRNPKLR